MEPEYVMIESVRDAQPDVEDGTTISSPGMESLDAAADAASTALRHAEAEGARGLAVFGQPVLVSELDAQAKIRELERHLEALKLQIAEREDADMGVDLVGLEDPVDGGAGQPPSAPGASGPAAEGVAPAAAVASSTSPTTRLAAADQPSMLATMAEPPLAWPVAAEPRPAAPVDQMEEDTTERVGLGFTPPAPAGYSSDPVDAMAADSLLLTPPARAQAPEPPRPTKRPAPATYGGAHVQDAYPAGLYKGFGSYTGSSSHANQVPPGDGTREPWPIRNVPGFLSGHSGPPGGAPHLLLREGDGPAL